MSEPNEDEAASPEKRQRRARRHEGVGRHLIGVEDLAVPAGGLLVGQEGPGQAVHDVVDEERLGPVDEQQRWDTPGRGVAEEGGDLQVRTLRRRS